MCKDEGEEDSDGLLLGKGVLLGEGGLRWGGVSVGIHNQGDKKKQKNEGTVVNRLECGVHSSSLHGLRSCHNFLLVWRLADQGASRCHEILVLHKTNVYLETSFTFAFYWYSLFSEVIVRGSRLKTELPS